MNYILNAMEDDIEIEIFIGANCLMKEIPVEVILKNLSNCRNMTYSYLATTMMNNHLQTNFDNTEFGRTLDLGDTVYIIKPSKKNGEEIFRYYNLSIVGDFGRIIRRPKSISVDDLIKKCNEDNMRKVLTPKTDTEKSRDWAIRDYFNRVDKAYRLYDQALMKVKPESYTELSYHKRTLARDLDIAFKKACDMKVPVKDIRDVEFKVLSERLRRVNDAR